MKDFRKIFGRLNWMQRYLVDEYIEDYQEGALSRREALKYLGAVLGSAAAATTVLAACAPMPNAASPTAGTALALTPTAAAADAAASPTAMPAVAVASVARAATNMASEVSPPPTPEETRAVATATVLATTDTTPIATPIPAPADVRVPEDDPDLQASDITFPGEGLELVGYLARPVGDGPFPAILVCHENRGLTDHIKDVTRRLATAGYVGLAVDLLSSQGGTAKVTDPAQIPSVLSSTSPDVMAGYFLSAVDYLQTQRFVIRDQLGMVGFCFGGGMTWLVATKAPHLRAAVPFYGPNPPIEAVPNIQAAVLAIYGGDDERINAGIPAIEEAMKQNGKVFEKRVYPGAGHAFHNDTGARYNPAAATDAWARTLEWFEKNVKGM